MIDDTVNKYLKEGMTSMNYGEVPEFRDFQKNFKKSVRAMSYNYDLKGADARTADKVGIPTGGDWSDKELYTIVNKLKKAWDKGDDNAGDLASSIMYTLNFEWI
jgi:hypothetical protein